MDTSKKVPSDKEISVTIQYPSSELVPKNISALNLYYNEGTFILDLYYLDASTIPQAMEKKKPANGFLVSRIAVSEAVAEQIKDKLETALKDVKRLK